MISVAASRPLCTPLRAIAIMLSSMRAERLPAEPGTQPCLSMRWPISTSEFARSAGIISALVDGRLVGLLLGQRGVQGAGLAHRSVLAFFVVIVRSDILLEGFDTLAEFAHQIADLAGAEQQQHHDHDNQPVPDAQSTHDNSPTQY